MEDFQAAEMGREGDQPDQSIEVLDSKLTGYGTTGLDNGEHAKAAKRRIDESYSCSLCNIALPSESKLKRHMSRHADERPHSRKQCEKSFSHKDI